MNPNKASAGKYPQSSVVDDQYQTPESQPSFKPKSSNYTSIRPSPRSPSSVNSEAAQTHPRPYLKKIANSTKGGFPSPGTPESAFEAGSVPEPIGSSIEHEVADAFRAQVFAACVASSKLHPRSLGSPPKVFAMPPKVDPMDEIRNPELVKYLSPRSLAQVPVLLPAEPQNMLPNEPMYGDVSDSFRLQVLSACEQAASVTIAIDTFMKVITPKAPNSPLGIQESPRSARQPGTKETPRSESERRIQSPKRPVSPAVMRQSPGSGRRIHTPLSSVSAGMRSSPRLGRPVSPKIEESPRSGKPSAEVEASPRSERRIEIPRLQVQEPLLSARNRVLPFQSEESPRSGQHLAETEASASPRSERRIEIPHLPVQEPVMSEPVVFEPDFAPEDPIEEDVTVDGEEEQEVVAIEANDEPLDSLQMQDEPAIADSNQVEEDAIPDSAGAIEEVKAEVDNPGAIQTETDDLEDVKEPQGSTESQEAVMAPKIEVEKVQDDADSPKATVDSAQVGEASGVPPAAEEVPPPHPPTTTVEYPDDSAKKKASGKKGCLCF